MKDNYIIRHATMDDLDLIAEVESLCFPKEEAATKESFYNRLEAYPDRFWLLLINDEIVSMVNGMVTNTSVLSDEMYSDSSIHDSNGQWQMIFGVETRPEYRCKGYADILLRKVISEVKNQNKKGIVLTCKDKLIHYYEKFGFVNEGISESKHGGEVWYQMKMLF